MKLYEKLGIRKKASKKEIQKAFHEKSKENHPDKGGNPGVMKELTEAYSVLRDDKRRAEYDKTGSQDIDAVKSQAMSRIVAAFLQLINGDDTFQVDFKKKIKELALKEIRSLVAKNDDVKLKIRKIEKVKKKIKSAGKCAFLLTVIEGQLSECDQMITKINQEVEINEKIKFLIDDFEYEFDAPEPIQRYRGIYGTLSSETYGTQSGMGGGFQSFFSGNRRGSWRRFMKE